MYPRKHITRARELNTRKSKQMKNFTEATETENNPSAGDAERIVAECDGDSSPRTMSGTPASRRTRLRQGYGAAREVRHERVGNGQMA